MLNIKNISKSYLGEKNNLTLSVLKNISLDIKEGQIVSILGESGIGKSTLLNIIGGLIRPDNGFISINNEEIKYDDNNSKLRISTFGYIFQSHCLLNEFTILENLILPQIIANKEYQNSLEKAKQYLGQFNMKNKINSYPDKLPMGEAQRVSVIRSIINTMSNTNFTRKNISFI